MEKGGTKRMKVLISIAHPDDEILSMGGTICKHIANGDEVYVLVFTEPNEDYSTEYKANKIRAQVSVDDLLGIEHRYCFNYPTVKLNTIPFGEINKKMSNYVDVINPDIIYTHFKHDINQDHRIVYEACLVATRPPKQIKLVMFETLSETEWGDEPFKPNYYIDMTDFLWKKIQAFSFYESEIKPNPHPRNADGIEILARQRGYESGYKHAEAFRIVRWYG